MCLEPPHSVQPTSEIDCDCGKDCTFDLAKHRDNARYSRVNSSLRRNFGLARWQHSGSLYWAVLRYIRKMEWSCRYLGERIGVFSPFLRFNRVSQCHERDSTTSFGRGGPRNRLGIVSDNLWQCCAGPWEATTCFPLAGIPSLSTLSWRASRLHRPFDL
jgi:hypothetical protein